MALSKKLKEQAKALKIPNYWNYGEKKLRELVKSKQPKKEVKSTPAKPKTPAQPKKVDNKKEILKHITACNKLIEDERKLIKGSKSAYHYSMLDRSLVSLKDVSLYLGKIQ